MSPKTDIKLTPRQRLTRGLHYSAVGPVDITRGAVGIGAHSAHVTAARLRRHYRNSGLADEVAAAQEVVSGLPDVLQSARKRRGHRGLVLAAVGVVTLAGGAVAFSVVRRSRQPEPSPRPPSVEVTPRP
jgi:hypothetical protein